MLVRLNYPEGQNGLSSLIVKFQKGSTPDREAEIYQLLTNANIKSVPKLFGVFDNGTLAIENMSPAVAGSEIKGCTLSLAKKVLQALAEIHGAFWNNKNIPVSNSEKFASVIDFNMGQCWDLFRNKYKQQLGERSRDFEWLWENAKIISAHRLSEPFTLFHGDMHMANILNNSDGFGEPVLIDWQLSERGLAANDITYFLVKSLSVNDRRANESQLLYEYYNYLPNEVKFNYSFDRFKLDYRACLTRSMFSAVMVVGPKFDTLPNRDKLADVLAKRVIAAVKDLNPIEAYAELQEIDKV